MKFLQMTFVNLNQIFTTVYKFTNKSKQRRNNNIISECSKLAQKEYKTRHDRVGKVIQWEMCKKFKFDDTNK